MLEGVAEAIQEIIEEIGRTVQIISSTAAAQKWKTPTEDAPADTVAAIVDFEAHETDGSVIQANDKKAFISTVSTLTKQDVIQDDGLKYNIENLRLVKPGNESFLYIAQLRA